MEKDNNNAQEKKPITNPLIELAKRSGMLLSDPEPSNEMPNISWTQIFKMTPAGHKIVGRFTHKQCPYVFARHTNRKIKVKQRGVDQSGKFVMEIFFLV